MKRLIYTLFLMTVWQLDAAGSPQTISWDNLIPKLAPLDDPFRFLTREQYLDLDFLISSRIMRRNGKISDVDKIAQEGIEIEYKLTREGLDVQQLFRDYDNLEREIIKRNKQINRKFDDKLIRIPGYILPLEHEDLNVRDLLLVPYFGACIHVPPPPPNQTVYVRLKNSYYVKGLYEPVWITGRLTVRSESKSLYYVDGSADIETAYTLEGILVEPYVE